jgi:hypothetical protein
MTDRIDLFWSRFFLLQRCGAIARSTCVVCGSWVDDKDPKFQASTEIVVSNSEHKISNHREKKYPERKDERLRVEYANDATL